MQHLQSLHLCFSKFNTKFDIDSLLKCHFAIELLSPETLKQILHNNFFQQAIYQIHLRLCKSKHNSIVVSKQLFNRRHILRHAVKALTPDGYSYYAICKVSPISF